MIILSRQRVGNVPDRDYNHDVRSTAGCSPAGEKVRTQSGDESLVEAGTEKKAKIKRFTTRLRQLLLMAGMLLLLYSLWMVFGVRDIPVCRLDSYISTDLEHEGVTRHFDSNVFDSPLEGDRLTFTIRLEEADGIPRYPVLCFSSYNAVITVRCGGEVLYTYGQHLADDGWPTGHVVVRCALPDPVPDTVTIEYLELEDHTQTRISDVCLLPAEVAWLYPTTTFSGQVTNAAFAVFIFISILLFVVFMIINLRGSRMLRGFYLTLFCISITLWGMGFTGGLYVLSNDDWIAPYVEYVAIFLAPVFFYGYLGVEAAGWIRKVSQILVSFCGTIFLIATFWQFFLPSHNGYLILLPLCYADLMVAAVFFISTQFHDRTEGSEILRVGIVCTFAVGILEVVRTMISRTGVAASSPAMRAFCSRVLAPYIVLILEASLAIDYMVRWYRIYQQKVEIDRLEAVAYTDGLTGLSNRFSFDEHERDNLERNEEYALAFIDADGLKHVNDTYGHRAGDQLLREVSRAIRAGAGKTGCRAYRYGGDEFLIVGADAASVQHAVNHMQAELLKANEAEREFPLSASAGMAAHKGPDAPGLDDIIRAADQNMYAMKQLHHKAREA